MKLALVLGLAVAATGGLGYGLANRGNAGPKGRVQLPVSSSVAALGYLEGARPEVPVRPEINGMVRSLPVRRGAQVAAGQVVLELANDSERARLELAQAELRRAQVELDQALGDLTRARRSGNSISKQDFDRCHFTHKAAQARLEESQARLHAARAELGKTQLRAPYACKVLEINVEPGQRVGPDSAEPAMVLADLSRRRVLAYVDEVDACRMAVGQSAVVTVDGVPDRSLFGKVCEVKPRMGRRPVHSDAPDEYRDVWSRGVYVDLEDGRDLPPNLRVKVKIQVP
jgi:RND family efflux transporter MFP subunit